MRIRHRLSAAVLGAGLAVALGLAATAPAHAGPTSDPATAARYGAGWIAAQLGTRGWLPSPTDASAPDLNATAYGLLALGATGGAGTAPARTATAYLKANVERYIVAAGADSPGPLATLVLAARANGLDPRSAFGTDVVARLQATRQASGLFGTADATYDGAYRQGLALAALGAAGVDDAAGVAWLRSQQCDDGGWLALRTDTSAPCPASDPANFTGEDSNSTAMAAMGLAAQDVTADHDAAAWFDRTQGTDGGWAYVAAPDQASDANSTALAVMALRTLDADARSARFTTSRDPVALLLSFQIGCEGGADAGALAYQPVRGDLTANALATVQAVPALAGVTLPFSPSDVGAGAAAGPTAVACPAGAPAGGDGSTGAGAGAGADAGGGAGADAGGGSGGAGAGGMAATGPSDTLRTLAGVGALLVAVGTALVVRTRRVAA